MELGVRAVDPSDFVVMRAIAASGGSPDADDRYFRFVRSVGRSNVATVDGRVIGFTAVMPIPGAAMVCDLFVDAAHRERGVGRRLLHSVLDGTSVRTTFSSTHPAALGLYREFGMVAGERLLTMSGSGVGGGPPLAAGPWRHDRPELVDHFRHVGATVTPHFVVRRDLGTTEVLRVHGADPRAAITRVSTSSAPGDEITLSILESNPLVPWLEREGYRVFDHDVRCSTPDFDVSTLATCVHRGLC